MKTSEELHQQLHEIHRKSYPAYKSLKGIYQFQNYLLCIQHVQGDPFASPSHISVRIPLHQAAFPGDYYKDSLTRTALCDYLIRQFEQQISHYTFRAKGSGKSGLICVSHCGQEVLKRTACEITSKDIIVRFFIGFPANGRTIQATELEKILFDFLPICVEKTFFYRNLNAAELKSCIELAQDQEFLRHELLRRKLVAFVADGSILPRESGISSRPMKNSIPFFSPESLRVSITLPHHGEITGMGIPQGITLIAGGGYHGKSTLLNALELGVYNHISGDGREYVITDETAVKLRAEDGRFIKDVDISLFINDLPNGKDTHSFSTLDASGSTSQAAGIVESMEAQSRVFLLDEDTSATNFMVRDAFMQKVIQRDKEPITPFLERARQLFEESKISTILVAGSSGAFFHIADTIIQMDNYRPLDITDSTRKLCSQYPLPDVSIRPFHQPQSHRIMAKASSAPARRTGQKFSGHGVPTERLKTKVFGTDCFSLGKQEINLRYIEQLVDSEQTATLSLLLKYATEHLIDGKRTLSEIVELLQTRLTEEGMNFLAESSEISCGYALPRKQEIYACFNRYRR